MEIKQIAAALVRAQKAFGPALKSANNPHFRSKYADLSACVEAVIDGLNNNGIALVQHTHDCEHGVTVETVFIHESGETYSAGKLHVPAVKFDAQGYGSALTYARRYSLMAACGIAPEDDDGNAASKNTSKTKAPEQKQTLELYSKERFEENRAAWQNVIQSGRKSVNEFIAMIETKGKLTVEQKMEIASWAVEGEKNENT